GAGRGPICSSFGSGGAVIPSTTTSVTSGAASCTAPSIASRTVTVEEGQPWQVPSSRSRATPSLTPRYCTPPACEPRYGRTRSSARWIRASTSSGGSPCSNNRPSTRGPAASRATMARPPRALPGQGGHDGRQAVPVHADQHADELLSGVGGRAAACPQGGQELLDPLARLGNAGHRASLPRHSRHHALRHRTSSGVRL